MTRAEWALLAIFSAASFAWFAVDAVHAAVNHLLFVGADGWYPKDQGQYLAWATDAAHHGLIANLYAFHLGAHVFLHPVWLVTGLLHVDAGLSYSLLLAAWKAVAIVTLFAALRTYARSILGVDSRKVAVAMLLALMMLSPTFLIGNVFHLALSDTLANTELSTETAPVLLMAGYFPTALAVAAMMMFLLQVDRLLASVDAPARVIRRHALLAGAAGCAASWLHPWQGMTLFAIVAGLVIWQRPSWRRHARLIAPLVLTALPLVYYQVLPRIDAGWALAHNVSTQPILNPSGYMLVAVVLPLAIVMLPGYAVRDGSARQRMLQLWPPAILIVYLISPTADFHALGGLSIPAALLSVNGWSWMQSRMRGLSPRLLKPLAFAAVCLLVVGMPIVLADTLRKDNPAAVRIASARSFELPRDDARALSVISSSPRGGVLTSVSVGNYVPGITDDPTWVGHGVWTPDYFAREARVADLFSRGSDGLTPQSIRAFVHSTGARYVLEPCGSDRELEPALAPAGFRISRIGCATLYRRP